MLPLLLVYASAQSATYYLQNNYYIYNIIINLSYNFGIVPGNSQLEIETKSAQLKEDLVT